MSVLNIDLAWTTDPMGLFADEADMDGVDILESAAEYDGKLIAAVRAAFPDAIVEHADRGRIWEETGDGDVNGYDTPSTFEARQAIQQLADDILQRGEWIVIADRNCSACDAECSGH